MKNIKLENLSYADFIGYMGIKNTPPGARKTIDYWILKSNIKTNDIILDFACSNGYSSQEIVKSIKCKAYGIDISDLSIKKAIAKSKDLGLDNLIDYQKADACCLPYKNNFFSHVVAGCCFAFVEDKNKALKEVYRVLKPKSYLLVSNFFYDQHPPEDMLNKAQLFLGFKPSKNWNQDFFNNLFSQNFSLVSRCYPKLNIYKNDYIKNRISDYVDKLFLQSNFDKKHLNICKKRLIDTRLFVN